MKIHHSIPARESRRHERTLDCPCTPSQTVTKAPGAQPTVTITHHSIPRSTR